LWIYLQTFNRCINIE
jgi:hypothetical protein